MAAASHLLIHLLSRSQLLSDSVSVEGCLDEGWVGPTYEVRAAHLVVFVVVPKTHSRAVVFSAARLWPK